MSVFRLSKNNSLKSTSSIDNVFKSGQKISSELISGEIMDFNIPMTKMRGSKPVSSSRVLKSWSWAKPYYELYIDIDSKSISKITIDPKNEMADVNRKNNYLVF